MLTDNDKRELIISTIKNEKHLGENLKILLINYINDLEISNNNNLTKDKIIDAMAVTINQAYFEEEKFWNWFEKILGVQQKMDYGYVEKIIKKYFEKKEEGK